MPFELHPANCKKCGQALEVRYQDRRHASMAVHLRLLLATGLLLTIVALPLLFVAAVWFMGEISDRWDLFRRDRRLLNGLAGFSTIPFSLLPGFLSWRYVFRQPKQIPIPCRSCGSVVICSIQETADLDELVQSSASMGTAAEDLEIAPQIAALPAADPITDRLERIRRRRQKQDHEVARLNDPNPEFDFDKPETIESEPLPPLPPPAGSSDAIKPEE